MVLAAATGVATGADATKASTPVVAGKGGELIVDEMIGRLHHAKDSSFIVPLLRALLPLAIKIDIKSVTELLADSGLDGKQSRDGSTTVTKTVKVNVSIDISQVWHGGTWQRHGDGYGDDGVCDGLGHCADAVGKPVGDTTVATAPAGGTTTQTDASKTDVAKAGDASKEPPANPAEAAKVINSMPTIVNVINVNFNLNESQKLRPMMKMGCLKKYLAARGP